MEKKFFITQENAEEYKLKICGFIKEYLTAANSKGAVIGMSGGIDCSVAARLCQEAKVFVKLVLLPDNHDMIKSNSMSDAMKLINKFNFDYEIINIKEACSAIEKGINPLSNLSKMNIRPRVRMTILYSIAQTIGSFVVGTSNLDERLLGYFTKWGDGACDINPLGMLTKNEVRILARALDIPQEIIDKPPSAGLYEGQTDESEFGFSYNEIDSYILKGTSGNKTVDALIKKRMDASRHKIFPIPIFND